MRLFILLVVLASTYYVEWIPNNATVAPAPPPSSSPGEFPWQL